MFVWSAKEQGCPLDMWHEMEPPHVNVGGGLGWGCGGYVGGEQWEGVSGNRWKTRV